MIEQLIYVCTELQMRVSKLRLVSGKLVRCFRATALIQAWGNPVWTGIDAVLPPAPC